ncbi:MAG: RagB/SusD family nutrient uptake outer membrane protein [Chitinophagaceae bacterium]|nr:RagB/SusD family nutrient uptake outer membrane protein [Bacteroidota bacterium]TAJ54174.1 MAG: RagB/SusD family nutrient uptake outer membrane protein [Chitinophagaceae bacterium]
MKRIFQSIAYTGLAAVLLTASGCKKDFNNPTAATSTQVLSTAKGLAGVAVGLQRTYANNVANGVADANGLITGETILMNAGNTSEFQFSNGGNAVDGTNALLGNVWSTSHKVIYDANNVINGAAALADKGYASGLIGYATIYKALSIGAVSSFWEKVPDTVGTSTTTFSDRTVGFARAIAAIDKALAAITASPISASFLSDIPAGVDIVNTLNALKARYSLFAGNYAAALAAANAVDLTKKSTLNFEAANPNPIYNSATSTNNLYQPVDSTLGLPVALAPTAGDKRIPFYTLINPTILPRFRLNGFWITATTPIPHYLPGEITLIKAECYARQTVPDLVNALIELNKVVTKKAAADPLGVGADLAPVAPVTTADLLNEIYKNRCIELYHSGLKLEDMRRFGRPNTERKRNLFPYPFRERDSNPNTPADPAF